jgi:hypothetical protein
VRSPVRGALADVALVVLARVATSLACLASGFRAISDDDYARVAIAARFAAQPSADPSGTSWLPLPFWLYGAPMWLFGDSLATARGVALVLGAASAALIWLAASWLGLPRRTALIGALGATLLPYGAWLSAATVPEAPTAALLVLGAVSLLRPEPQRRLVGALALGAACFSRYEAWAPALVFALVTTWDAWRARSKWLAVAVAAPLVPMALWLLHGVFVHGDAWFFVARVTQYRAALGREASGWASALLSTPLALVRFEPELWAVFVVALGAGLKRGESPFTGLAWRPVVLLASLVALLIIGDARGGSATHHPERSLLPVFWFLALITAGLVSNAAANLERAWLLPALALPLALAGALWLRPPLLATFVDRREEEHIGRLLRRIDARGVALDTDDFGYFAIQAALGHGKSFVLDEHDPRQQALRPAANAEELRARLGKARWLVTPHERAALAGSFGVVQAKTERFTLLALTAPR